MSTSNVPHTPHGSPRGSISLPQSSPQQGSAANPEAEALFLRQQLEQANHMGREVERKLRAAEARVASLEQQAAPNSVIVGGSSKPRLKAPPMSTFHGEIGFAVDNWLRDAEDQFEFYGQDEFPDIESKLRFVKTYMRGAARDWWDNEPEKDKIKEWSNFIERVHHRFRPLAAADFARQRLLLLKQKSSVSMYCNLFQKEMTPIKDMGEADKIFFFRHGLRPDIAREVKKPKSLSDAMDQAVRAEGGIVLDRSHSNASSFFAQRQGANSLSNSSRNYGAAPMDINNIEYEGEEVQSIDTQASSEPEESSSNPLPSKGADPQMLALMQEMRSQNQQLFAMFQSRVRPRQREVSSSASRVPDVTADEVRRCREKGLCIKCKKPGHIARDCKYVGPAVRLN